jgi:hypothetical protein
VCTKSSVRAFADTVWLYFALACRPQFGLADYGSKDQYTVTSNVNTQDSYNPVSNWINSLSDSGNVSLNLGSPSGDVVSNLVPLVAAVFALLGGLYLITRR